MDPISKARLADSNESKRGKNPTSLSNLRMFPKGVSGNPGGRKKKLFTDICDKVIKKNRKEIETIMMKIIRKEQMAAVLLLREIGDHHEGPVTQSIEISNLAAASDEELLERLKKLTA